jgi:hypothetical protein
MDFSKINYHSFLGCVVRFPLRLLPQKSHAHPARAITRQKVGVGAGEAFFDMGVSVATGSLSDYGTVSERQVCLDERLADGRIACPGSAES